MDKQRIRTALIEQLEGWHPTIFVTLMLNRSLDGRLVQRPVVDFLNRVQRRAHGKRWRRFPPEEQLRAYAFLEHPESGPHWHAVATGSERIIDCLSTHGEEMWSERDGSGYAHIELPMSRQAVARYATKCMLADWSVESFIAYAPDP